MKNNADLTDMARTSRSMLRAAFARKFTSRVWDSTAADPSFFRDAAVVLVPPFTSAKHLDMLKSAEGDDVGLTTVKKELVPTTNAEVQSVRDRIWDEIRERAVRATLVEGARKEDMALARERKRLKASATAGAPSPGDRAWAMFEKEGMGTDTDSDAPQPEEARKAADVRKSVDDEIQRFKEIRLAPGSMPPRNALVFWSGSAMLQFPKLWRVAQQVYGNQSSAAQIERDFGGAGQLLSSRRGRIDSMYIEMMLFLHVNFKNIPHRVPAIKTDALGDFLPKRFIRTDADFEEAMRFVNTDMLGNEADVGGTADIVEL